MPLNTRLPEKKIGIKLSKNQKWAVLTFWDEGIGIPKTENDRIFDRFYRASSETSGTGLGLAISKWITEIHNGTIELQSQEGKGSQFIVKLPLVQKELL